MFCAGATTDKHYTSLSTYGRVRKRQQIHIFSSVLLGVLVGTLTGVSIAVFFLRPEYAQLLVPSFWKNNAPFMTKLTVMPDASEDLGLETLRDMVARTKGYWARDYSLQLGWNNVSHYSPELFIPYNAPPDEIYNRNRYFTWNTS
jgi:hypothetical protein